MMAGRYPIALALAWGLVAGPGCADDHKVAAHQTSEVAASKIHYAYDAVGRLIQAASDDGTGVEYSYDAVGNIAAIRRRRATWSRSTACPRRSPRRPRRR